MPGDKKSFDKLYSEVNEEIEKLQNKLVNEDQENISDILKKERAGFYKNTKIGFVK